MKQKCLIVSFGLLGLTALIFQVVFAKKLMLIFGLTAPAVATVLAVYFAGLALGSFIFGRIADKFSHKLQLIYAIIFLASGVYGLFTPYLFVALGKLIQVINHIYPLNFSGFNFFAFLLSFLFLIIPSTLIGGAWPVVSKMFIQASEAIGKKFSLLYFVDVFGSALGAAMAGFIFLPMLGNRATIILASAINIIIALSIYFSKESFAPAGAPVVSNEKEKLLSSNEPVVKNKIFLVVLFVTGFLALALEVIYTKTLILFIGSSTYAFSLILVIFLLGMALGSLVAVPLVERLKQNLTYLGSFFGLLGFV